MKNAGKTSMYHIDKGWFRRGLLKWNEADNQRQMPWKGLKDPYKIWLSEVILQQTRVEQGLGYYERFINNYPSISKLAAAPEEKVFKLWEGLGYYSRCRNLIATARFIAHERKGKFPDTYEEILKLKGVGPYTAAAIASFAYNLPHAVVDGNVFRVISRVFGIRKPIDSTEGKKLFAQLSEELLDKRSAGSYNQAIMDFGATVCKPQAPLCNQCPFRKKCIALQDNIVDQLPVKSKKLTIKKRWFHYLIVESGQAIYVRKRTGKDIWNGLYEFILLESSGDLSTCNLLQNTTISTLLGKSRSTIVSESAIFIQQLTHQQIHAKFTHININKPLKAPGDLMLVALKDLRKLAFPKIITQYLEQKM
jgi:A/G-specific adenine glycosylase